MQSDVVIDGDPRNPNVFNWDPRSFDNRILSEAGILKCFDACDAAWMHDGNPESPHAELTRGKCSNGFFDCTRVLCHSNLNEILARQLVRKLKAENLIDEVDWVVGSSYAAITFSYEVAKALGAVHSFTEKDPNDPKKQVWRKLTIPKGANVLQVEELITTSQTFKGVRRAVKEGNSEPVNFLPVVGTLVHRPPELPVAYMDDVERNPIGVHALIEKAIWAVEPEDCPLCKQGSKRVQPKANWAELTGKA